MYYPVFRRERFGARGIQILQIPYSMGSRSELRTESPDYLIDIVIVHGMTNHHFDGDFFMVIHIDEFWWI